MLSGLYVQKMPDAFIDRIDNVVNLFLRYQLISIGIGLVAFSRQLFAKSYDNKK